jgi:4-hydroxy-tetrahydrodipicolinate synthase
MSASKFHGVIPPVPTILNDDGSFDRDGMGVLIDRLLLSDINGFLFLGSAGEFAQLPTSVRKEVAEFCIARVAGRRPVIIGTASCSTREVIELSCHAAASGADAVIVVNPYYSLLTEERIYSHYRQIAEASSIPVFLYNFPALTGQDLSVELVQRLARDCPNVIGIKDTVDCLSHIRRMILEVKGMRPDFLVFCGFDEYMLDTLLLGGEGVIPATSNFAPEITTGIYKAFRDSDFASLKVLIPRLAALSKMYSIDAPFIGLVKEAIRVTGSAIPTGVSAPGTPPDAAMKLRLVEILTRSGVLPA